MTDTQLAALRKAGVWPEGIDQAWIAGTERRSTARQAAEAMLIVEMMERLPDDWLVGKGQYMKLDSAGSTVIEELVYVQRHDRLIDGEVVCKHETRWQALYSALVAAGIVKETT